MVRWFVCQVDSDAHGRWPRLSRIVDPSRPAVPGEDHAGNPTLQGKFYRYVCVISDGKVGQVNAWCVCLVWSRGDFAPILAAAQIVDLFEQSFEDIGNWLATTPKGLGWSNAKMIRIRDRLIARGVDVTGITPDTPLWRILWRIGQRIQPGWDPRNVMLRP